MKIFSALWDSYHPFDSFYPDTKFIAAFEPEDLTTSDGFLIIWGGEDIHPSIYNRPNMGSHVGNHRSERDVFEEALCLKAIEIGLPIVGVCRGAQLGCALAGGILIQDIDRHTSGHKIYTEEHTEIHTSSLHHQMMFPWLIDKFHLIAWDERVRKHIQKPFSLNEDEFNLWVEKYNSTEPEIIWFSEIKCLAIQGHPEFMRSDDPFNIYIKELTDKYIYDEL